MTELVWLRSDRINANRIIANQQELLFLKRGGNINRACRDYRGAKGRSIIRDVILTADLA